ncbi:MAG: dephospho-CoA kinase [Deferribacteres bacterium]|nr:dephospho-CoA kinase [candidate division KSB1 bacterium]MCB9502546.1 dephospho-CoA kinase [Deferribacteres bacterium]
MYKIGLTGSMGSGKSTVREILAQKGFATIDADSLAKEIIKIDPQTIEKIRAEFGPDVYDNHGELMPTILAEKAFGDIAKVNKLNEIVHPRVFEKVDEQIAVLQKDGETLAFIEAALFFETGWDKQMDLMITVSAPQIVRIKRIQKRSGLQEEQIKARLLHQLPDSEKVERADIVFLNDSSLDHLHDLVETFLSEHELI